RRGRENELALCSRWPSHGHVCIVAKRHPPNAQRRGTGHTAQRSSAVKETIAGWLVGLIPECSESAPIGLTLNVEKNYIGLVIVRGVVPAGRARDKEDMRLKATVRRIRISADRDRISHCSEASNPAISGTQGS